MHDHDHQHHSGIQQGITTRLCITLAINTVIPVAQVIGGIQAGSIALVSDAVHNFSDSIALALSLAAHRIGRRSASPRFSFGFRRAEILAALANTCLLLGALAFILIEAGRRALSPQEVRGLPVILFAVVGIVGNGISAFLLARDAKDNLNIRGAFLHLLGDTLTSVIVAASGVIFLFFPWYWIDPLLSAIIALFIFRNCWALLKEAVLILMNGVPSGLDLETAKEKMEDVEGVRGVHYLHAWHLADQAVAFSCHVVVDDLPVSETEEIGSRIREILEKDCGILHPVLQFETLHCGGGGLLCGHRGCATGDESCSSVSCSSE